MNLIDILRAIFFHEKTQTVHEGGVKGHFQQLQNVMVGFGSNQMLGRIFLFRTRIAEDESILVNLKLLAHLCKKVRMLAPFSINDMTLRMEMETIKAYRYYLLDNDINLL